MKIVKYTLILYILFYTPISFAYQSCDCEDCKKKLRLYLDIICSHYDCGAEYGALARSGFTHYEAEDIFFNQNEKVMLSPSKRQEILNDPASIMSLNFQKIDNTEFTRLQQLNTNISTPRTETFQSNQIQQPYQYQQPQIQQPYQQPQFQQNIR